VRFQEDGQKKWLYFLPLIFLIWVNCHIYFFFGLFLLGAFWVEEVLRVVCHPDDPDNYRGEEACLPVGRVGRARQGSRMRFLASLGMTRVKNLALIGFISVFATLLNPAGLQGLLFPFQIFQNYGYRVLENQTFFFLKKIIFYPSTIYFEILLGLLIFSWCWRIFWLLRRREKFPFAFFLISVFISYLGLKAVRNFALFGLLAPVLIAVNFSSERFNAWLEKKELPVVIILLITIFVCFFFAPHYRGSHGFGLGLLPDSARAGQFFREQKIGGPIFNNYDIGGYLIYYLYPPEKVFVDNRPEAYPADFFQNDYIAAQENDARWQELDKKYNFNAIFFYRLDLTPWGQNFLITRAADLKWRVVFVDEENIIFVKDSVQNKRLIEKYGLPREMFGAKK
jgi:hypothetical protein